MLEPACRNGISDSKDSVQAVCICPRRFLYEDSGGALMTCYGQEQKGKAATPANAAVGVDLDAKGLDVVGAIGAAREV